MSTATDLLLLLGSRATADLLAPIHLASLPIFWYKADAITGKADGAALAAGDILDYSGNGNHIATAVAVTFKTNVYGTMPGIRFNGTTAYLKTPSFTQAQPLTLYIVFKQLAWTSAHRFIDGIATSLRPNLLQGDNVSPSIFMQANSAGSVLSPGPAINTPVVLKAHWNAGLSHLWLNWQTGSGAETTGTNGYTDGMTIGSAFNAPNIGVNLDICELALYAGLPSAADDAKMQAYFIAKYGMANYNSLPGVTFVGDSLTKGTQSTAGQTYPRQVMDVLGQTAWRWLNYGGGGLSTANWNTNAATMLTPLYSAARPKNIAVIWLGTNDISGGADAATTFSRITTLHATVRGLGFKTIALTIIKRGPFNAGQETIRQTVNASIVANSPAFCDAVVDVAADAGLQNPADGVNYNADQVHLTNAGYTIVAGLVQPAISAQ